MASLILSIIFILLAILHFYWAGGGTWLFDSALPTDLNGSRILNPKNIHSFAVGIFLGFHGIFYLQQCNSNILSQLRLPNWIGWVVVLIFAFRAIGDFRYVGFFKKIKQTTFGTMDTYYYSPLCLAIASLALYILISKK